MKRIGRRNFLKILGIGAGAASANALTKPFGGSPAYASRGWPGVNPFPGQGGDDLDWRAIDDHHEEAVQIFLGQIGTNPKFWNNTLEHTMDGDTKVFQLTTRNVQWSVGTAEGMTFPGYAYNDSIPGPAFRVTEGDKVRIILNNEMNQSTAIHWHGLDVPNDQDGVPFVTQPVVEPGTSYVYEFVVPNPGTHMYHSHHNSLEQIVGGLLGPFIVEPLDKSQEPQYDSDYVMTLNDSALGFTINGKSFPYVEPIVAKVGERIRLRYMNEGLMIHPMHLHGMPQWVFAKDGYNLPNPYFCDTLNIAPGERYDVIITARAVGAWAFHCHIISHVENRNGMFGMVCPLVVTE